MRFPIAENGMAYVAASAAVQRTDFESKRPTTTEDGRPVCAVVLLAMDGEDALPIRVRVEGDPEVVQGQPVRPVGLTLNKINRKGEVMEWWTVERLEPVTAAPAAAGEGPAGEGGPGRRGGKAAGQ